jgi:RNA polymerase sigma factor (sigma-70 family)
MPDADLIPTRESLLSRLGKPGNEESWRFFFDTYWKLIYGTARKAGLNETEAQEVVQETVLCVFKKIPSFEYDPAKGSFKGWLLKLTRWRIADQYRKRRPAETSLDKENRLDALGDMPEAGSVLEAHWNHEWESSLTQAAFDRVKRRIDPGHYQVFDLVVLRECPVKEVQARLKMSAGQIYVIKHRVEAEVKKELQAIHDEKFL